MASRGSSFAQGESKSSGDWTKSADCELDNIGGILCGEGKGLRDIEFHDVLKNLVILSMLIYLFQ